jgi:hypothetical protein
MELRPRRKIETPPASSGSDGDWDPRPARKRPRLTPPVSPPSDMTWGAWRSWHRAHVVRGGGAVAEADKRPPAATLGTVVLQSTQGGVSLGRGCIVRDLLLAPGADWRAELPRVTPAPWALFDPNATALRHPMVRAELRGRDVDVDGLGVALLVGDAPVGAAGVVSLAEDDGGDMAVVAAAPGPGDERRVAFLEPMVIQPGRDGTVALAGGGGRCRLLGVDPEGGLALAWGLAARAGEAGHSLLSAIAPPPPEAKKLGYLYLLREREFLERDEATYKVGMTRQAPENFIHRLRAYKRGSELVLVEQCAAAAAPALEREVLAEFARRFRRHGDGTEFFVGDPAEMRDVISAACRRRPARNFSP